MESITSTYQRSYSQLKKSLQIIHQNACNNIIPKQLKYKNRNYPYYQINNQILIKFHAFRSKLAPRYSIIGFKME
jgi:hypothetical protein